MLLFSLALATLQDAHATAPAITAQDLSRRIRTLSSDAFEGRGPSSKGEELTLAYLVREMERAGLEPGYHGEWFQPVSLVGTTPTDKPVASVTRDGTERELVFGRDLMFVSPVLDGKVSVTDSEIVFVGYGVVAPEFGWNDYAGIDVKGKTVLCLVNDPGYATKDPDLFRGHAMTYYGRYTYKYEEAARQGAAACFVIHEEGAAGYPWQVVVRSWGGTQFGLPPVEGVPELDVEGWMTEAAAAQLIGEAGGDGAAWFAAAEKEGFEPRPLGATASFSLENGSERSESNNVVGMIVGSERPREAVLFGAHWDHLGRRPGVGDDEIYNGALDNASGTSGMLELAEAFGALDPSPKRTLLFVAFAAEESGLLGSKRYAEAPAMPLADTVAGLNMDGMNLNGPTEDIVVVGFGASELDGLLADAVEPQGRRLSPEPTPEKGYYYRSDHFSLAKHGVPMLYTDAGIVHREHGEAFMTAAREDYLKKRYHQPSDEFDPDWDLRGAIEDLEAFYALALGLANSDAWPTWVEGNEFEAVREASLRMRER